MSTLSTRARVSTTADQYVASVIDQHRVEGGPGSPTHEASQAMMSFLQQWGNRYLLGMVPSGAYAKGTAVSLCAHIDLLLMLSPIPGWQMRDIYWSLFDYLAGRDFWPRAHHVTIRVQHRGITLDLIPACRPSRTDSGVILFDQSSRQEIPTSVAEHVHLVSRSGRGPEITALKIWRERNSLTLPSLLLEFTVIEALQNERFGQLADNVLTALRYISSRFEQVVVRDPANPDNVISDVLPAAEKKKIAQAARSAIYGEDWKKILW